MARPAQKRALSRRRRIATLVACTLAGLVLAVPIYVGLVEAGLVEDPRGPSIEGDIALARSDRVGLRVLFVGNSLTYSNSMPALVHQLAAGDEGARPIFSVGYTAPGWTLREAAADDGLAELITDVRWSAVVLQEQSQLLSFSSEQRRRTTYPFARALQRQITPADGRTILFMTWGHEHGDGRNFIGDTFDAMQARLEAGYSELGAALPASVAPVGLAWAEALRREPALDLWERDGKHPNPSGSYLAACVFYAMLSGRDPSESAFAADLEPDEARFLQRVASDVVDTAGL